MVKGLGKKRRLLRSVRRLFYRNEIFLLLTALFFIGILLGSCLIRSNGSSWQIFIEQIVSGFSSARGTQAFLSSFLQSLTGGIAFLLAIFLCGFCAVGQPLICLIILFRGMGYGLTAGGVYRICGVGGMGYVALALLPNCVLTALILLRAGQSAFRFSTGLYGAMKGSGKMSSRPYCLEFSFFAVFMLAAALIDSVCSWFCANLAPVIG